MGLSGPNSSSSICSTFDIWPTTIPGCMDDCSGGGTFSCNHASPAWLQNNENFLCMAACDVDHLLVALHVLQIRAGVPCNLKNHPRRNDSYLFGIHSLIHDNPEFLLLSRTYRSTYTITGYQAVGYYKHYYHIHVFSFVLSGYSRRRIQVLVGIGNRHIC